MKEVVHRDITTFIEEMDLKHRTLANAGKYEQIHYMLPFEPLSVFVVGKGNLSHKYIDIAGTCWSDKGYGSNPAGATGFGVKTLVNLICNKTN